MRKATLRLRLPPWSGSAMPSCAMRPRGAAPLPQSRDQREVRIRPPAQVSWSMASNQFHDHQP